MRCNLSSSMERALSIIIEGDCLPLITNMLKSSQIHNTTVGFYVRDILSFVKWFDFVSRSFIKRCGNRVAHDLTHRRPLCLEGKIWDSDIPDDVLLSLIHI